MKSVYLNTHARPLQNAAKGIANTIPLTIVFEVEDELILALTPALFYDDNNTYDNPLPSMFNPMIQTMRQIRSHIR